MNTRIDANVVTTNLLRAGEYDSTDLNSTIAVQATTLIAGNASMRVLNTNTITSAGLDTTTSASFINRPVQSLWVGVTYNPTNSIVYSTDNGTTFQNLRNVFASGGYCILWDGSKFIAGGGDVGNRRIQYSYNGLTWSNATSGVTITPSGLAYGNTIYVAVGSTILGQPGIQYSYDALTWQNASGSVTPFSNVTGGGGICVAYNGRMWLAGGVAATGVTTLYYSYNGINWSNTGFVNTFTTATNALAWNGQLWVGVGNDTSAAARIKYSYDGFTWQNSKGGVGFIDSIKSGVAWNGQLWVATSANTGNTATGSILHSYDGINWNPNVTGGFGNTTGNAGYSIAWNGNRWVAGGAASAGSSKFQYSTDGSNWTANVTTTVENGYGIAYSVPLQADITTTALNIYAQGQINFTSTNHQLLVTPSTMSFDTTLYINKEVDRTSISIGLFPSTLYTAQSYYVSSIGVGNQQTITVPLAINDNAHISTLFTSELYTSTIAAQVLPTASILVMDTTSTGTVQVSRTVTFDSISTSIVTTQLYTQDTVSLTDIQVNRISTQTVTAALGIISTATVQPTAFTTDVIGVLGVMTSLSTTNISTPLSRINVLSTTTVNASTFIVNIFNANDFGYSTITASAISAGQLFFDTFSTLQNTISTNVISTNVIDTTIGIVSTLNIGVLSSINNTFPVLQTNVLVADYISIGRHISVPTARISTVYADTVSSFVLNQGVLTQEYFSVNIVSAGTVNVDSYLLPGVSTTVLAASNLTGYGSNYFINPTVTSTFYVALGQETTTANWAKWSVDGITWNNGNWSSSSSIPRKVAWNGSMWVAASSAFYFSYSYDGRNWTSLLLNGNGLNYTPNPNCVGWNGSVWVLAGNGSNNNSGIYWSSNGLTWNIPTDGSKPYPNDFNSGRGATCIGWNGQYFLVGGQSNASGDTFFAKSFDGKRWTTYNPTAAQLNNMTCITGLAWNGRMWVATGCNATANARIQYSYDGSNWFATRGVWPSYTSNALDVQWNGEMFIARVNYSAGGTFDNTIKYSYNGIDWSNSSSQFNLAGSNASIIWSGNKWVACGPNNITLGRIKYSYNGINWFDSQGASFGTQCYALGFASQQRPDIQTNNLQFFLQNQPNYLSTNNQILTTQSTLVLNNTLYVYNTKPYVTIAGRNPMSTPTTFALDVVGQGRFTSTLFADAGVLRNGLYVTSDKTAKMNIELANTDLCYSNLKSLPLKRFHYIDEYSRGRYDKTQLGFVAQEVTPIFPKSVREVYNEEATTSLLHINKDQIHMMHYGATHKLIRGAEEQDFVLNRFCDDTVEHVQEQSTIQATTFIISTISASYDSLVSNLSTLLGQAPS